MYKEDYIDNETRIVTRRVEDRDAVSVHFITEIQKRDALHSWSRGDHQINYVRAEAERTHEDVRKEQERLCQERELIAQKEREAELERQAARERTLEEMRQFNQQERERAHHDLDREDHTDAAHLERTRERTGDQDHDRKLEEEQERREQRYLDWQREYEDACEREREREREREHEYDLDFDR